MQRNATQLNCSRRCQASEALPVDKAGSAILGLCFVLGVPGNVAALVILVRRLKVNSFTLSLMLMLAVSDLLTLLTLPIWMLSSLNCWIFGSAACKIISCSEYWCIYCSGLCVTLIGFQRYMQVLHPQKWAKVGVKGQKGLLCGIWILSGVLSSYAPVKREEKCDCSGCYCVQTFRNETESVGILLLEILVFVMCFFLLAVSYCLLHRGVHQSPFFSSNRMTQLVTRIFVAFFILYGLLPISNFLNIVALLLKNENLRTKSEICAGIARALTCLNSCVNPFLYTFAVRELHPDSHLEENT